MKVEELDAKCKLMYNMSLEEIAESFRRMKVVTIERYLAQATNNVLFHEEQLRKAKEHQQFLSTLIAFVENTKAVP